MVNSRLWHSFRCLSANQINEFEKFVDSPFHNQRKDVIALFQYLRNQLGRSIRRNLRNEAVFAAIYPKEKFQLQKLRYTLSFLNQLLQQYLQIKELEGQPIEKRMLLVKGYQCIGDQRSLEIEFKKTQKSIETQSLRNGQFHQWQYEQLTEAYARSLVQTRSNSEPLEALDHELDVYYISQKFRHAAAQLTHQQVSSIEVRQHLLPVLVDLIESEPSYLQYPAIRVYYAAYRALTQMEQEEWFVELKDCIMEYPGAFSEQEWKDLYLLAINYCIRRLNQGHTKFVQEVFDLYQQGLSDGVFFEGGFLSRFTYNNIVMAALRLEAFDWVKTFIDDYAERIAPQFREQTHAYNLAIYHYQLQEYDAALDYLRSVVTSDMLHGLDVRRMMVRIYFEQQETQALLSLLDSFKSYLYHKSNLGYHKNHYLNFLRFVRQLMDPEWQDETRQQQLRKAILETKELADRHWLLQRGINLKKD